ncbi:1-hydroxycarotenoid 3,4-desaturase CrtD [Sphingomonas sp. PAMC 26605]|uniref:1-hydroxycarotenoid 3,4-desaturase CrtD n=1 Tax=Sphingomonas sp. PAMC 26605 TaxID=1112214 RepID=UPI00026CA1CE|nr:1-hydroxycarotenoid 3,4-desaturase CrtD [Sphingomonas sp. PAMC 26605]
MSSQDTVLVVGAGIGGLASAALLAARGVPVTVVEAAAGPGGKMREIVAGGVAIDAGPTVFTLRQVFDEIFADCGSALESHLTLTPATVLARHAWGDDRLDLFADPAASEAAIGAFAGARAAAGYRAFRAEARRIFETLDAPFLRAPQTNPLGLTWRMGWRGLTDLNQIRPYETLWSALGTHFDDPRLRQLFGRYATYCGSSPFLCPATLMLVAHVEAAGVWLISGGMHALAKALEALALRHGAIFRYGAPVRDIVIERGRAAGVRLASGERIDAAAIVCNADPAALAHGAFGAAARAAVAPQPARGRSLSALVWCANGIARGFPLVRHSVFFARDSAAEFADLAAGRVAADPTVYVCAQDRDAKTGAGAGGSERLQIIVNAPATGDTAPLTQAEIEQCTQSMHATLQRAGLTLELPEEATVLTTPSGFNGLFPRTGGALYGPASHGWAASFRRPGSRTRIPGLYCAGGSTHPGAGVPMAALSARLAVACLLKDRVSTSQSTRTAMPGGMSTRSAPIVASA